MTEKDIEFYNNAVLKKEYRKQYTNYLCAAVEHEMKTYLKEYQKEISIVDAFNNFKGGIVSYSRAWTEYNGIKPLQSYCILETLFDFKNNIPAYIVYWLCCRYESTLGKLSEHTSRNKDIYNELWNLYVCQRRFDKENEKDLRKCEKEARRQLCQLYKSGRYEGLFKLYSKADEIIIDSQELEDVDLILGFMWGKLMKPYELHDTAAAWLIGELAQKELPCTP